MTSEKIVNDHQFKGTGLDHYRSEIFVEIYFPTLLPKEQYFQYRLLQHDSFVKSRKSEVQ